MGHYNFAIGCDEFNNGFHLKNFPHLIVAGVLGSDGREYGTPKYAGKHNRKFFSHIRKTDMEKVLECSRYFFEQNPHFLYVTINKDMIKTKTDYELMKAKAVSTIALTFLKEKNLNPNQTALYIDKMNGVTDLSFIEDTTNLLLSCSSNEPAKVRFIEHGERTKKVIKKADMVAYYLAAQKVHGSCSCWPHRDRRLDVKNLATLFC